MSKKITGFVAALLTGTILVLLVAATWPAQTQAAPLAAGAYTYVIAGEEVAFPYDPIARKEGVLVPLDLFTHLGVQVTGALERTVVLEYGPVSTVVTVGRVVATVSGESEQLKQAPVRLNGRLFLPAELLEFFGFSFSQEGNYVTVNAYVETTPSLTRRSAAEWAALKERRTVLATVRADSGIYLNGEFTLLNPELLLDENLPIDYATRTRLLGLSETNTLLLVSLSNRTLKSGALQTAGLFLIDSERNQYEVSQVVDLGKGLVSTKLAPAADRMGVLLLPQLEANAGLVKLYYENNGVVLGQFPR